MASTRDAVMELGGQRPLASSPRSEVSPSPSCPYLFWPQHLTVASSWREATDNHHPVQDWKLGRVVRPGTAGARILNVVPH